MLQLYEKTQVVTNISGILTLFSRKYSKESLLWISHTGNQMLSQIGPKVPPLSSSPSVLRLVIPSHIFPQLLCMLCLRMSSLSCSQAGNTTRPVRRFHLKISHMPVNLTDVIALGCYSFWTVNMSHLFPSFIMQKLTKVLPSCPLSHFVNFTLLLLLLICI